MRVWQRLSDLPLIQTLNFDAWERYHDWAAHVQAATALLELRGQQQFTRDRGGQLYIQIRSQIVSACPYIIFRHSACIETLSPGRPNERTS